MIWEGNNPPITYTIHMITGMTLHGNWLTKELGGAYLETTTLCNFPRIATFLVVIVIIINPMGAAPEQPYHIVQSV